MKNEDVKFLNENLYKFRKEKGISQEELGNIIGVSRQAVYKWESGERMPDFNNLNALCKFFNKDIEEFVQGATYLYKNNAPKEAEVKNSKKIINIIIISISIIVILYILITLVKCLIFNTILLKISTYKNSNNYYYENRYYRNYDYYDSQTDKIENVNYKIKERIWYKDEVQKINITSDVLNANGYVEIWNYFNPENKAHYSKSVSIDQENFYTYSVGFTLEERKSPYELVQNYIVEYFNLKNVLNPFKILKIDFDNNNFIIENLNKNMNIDCFEYTKQIIYIDLNTCLLNKIEEYAQNELTYSSEYYNYKFDSIEDSQVFITEEEKNEIVTNENAYEYYPTVWSGGEQVYP